MIKKALLSTTVSALVLTSGSALVADDDPAIYNFHVKWDF